MATANSTVHRLVVLQVLSDAYEEFLEEAMDPQNAEPRQMPALAEEVNRLRTLTLSKGSSCIGEMCAVCREDFQCGDKLTSLACTHHFHDSCLRPWLRLHNTCPKCRYPLLTSDREHNELVMQFRQQREAADRKVSPLTRSFATNRRLTRRRRSLQGMMPLGNRTLRMPSIGLGNSGSVVVHSRAYSLTS
mmetsp:Transcript_35743/g.69432  ORF Transcript_35743/g.69432 Transcript_35743/m.69432 type:complete len:190 (+) Transcript_35743:93-662(+)